MITFPNAKINLGLNIVEKRPDGYHNLETIFYPVGVEDALEINDLTGPERTTLHLSGMELEGDSDNNLVIKAYHLLKNDFDLPPISIRLHKNIPSGAGLGGGSADAAFMLKLLNERYELHLSPEQLEDYSGRLGADCAFFIKNEPVFATGIGNIFHPIELDLTPYYICIIKPDIHVSTAQAFAMMVPKRPAIGLREVVKKPIEEWKELMHNDFENTVFAHHPEIERIKQELYTKGAIYASMSGSGSSVYGLFSQMPSIDEKQFPNAFIRTNKL